MTSRLSADEYRRLLDVVGWAGAFSGTPEFRPKVLEAMDEYLGYTGSAFFVAGPPVPGFQALDGVVHGYAQRGLEEYAANWSRQEPFGRPTALAKLRRGRPVLFEDVFERRSSEHRDYVDFWLRPQRIAGYMLLWLDCGLPVHGYLSLLSDHSFEANDRDLLIALRPHLQAFLRRSLPAPRTVEKLSPRESEVAGLVAGGRSNAEVARHLGVEEDTVKKHVSRAMAKIGVRRRTQLALALGPPPDDSTFVQ